MGLGLPLVLLLIPLVLMAGRARAQEPPPRIAVLEFQSVEIGRAEVAAASDQLHNELVNFQVFTVLDRDQIKAILGEMAFQQGGFTDPAQVQEVGKLLNVEYIVTGRITSFSGAYQVKAQLVRVETGEIVRSETVLHRGDFIDLLTEQMPLLAARLAQVEPKEVAAETSAPPPSAAATTPAAAPPPGTTARRRPGPMMIFGGGKPTWALMMGGMMLAGAAVISSQSSSGEDEDEDSGGTSQTLPVMMGLAGAGMIAFYIMSDSEPGTAYRPGGPPTAWAPPLLLAINPGEVRAGYSWRW